jgi:hypothetical protein
VAYWREFSCLRSRIPSAGGSQLTKTTRWHLRMVPCSYSGGSSNQNLWGQLVRAVRPCHICYSKFLLISSKPMGPCGPTAYTCIRHCVLRIIVTPWCQADLEDFSSTVGEVFLLVGHARSVLDGRQEISPWIAGFKHLHHLRPRSRNNGPYSAGLLLQPRGLWIVD